MGQERAETEARHAKAEEREKVDHRQIHLIIHEDLRSYLERSVYNTSRRRCFRIFDFQPMSNIRSLIPASASWPGPRTMSLPVSGGGLLATRQRVWLAVLLYTGLRRGDAVKIGKQHVHDGVVTLQTKKTDTNVHILLLPPLIEALKAGPTADLAFICGADGKPMAKEAFANAFRDACRAAGISKSAHGLRKLAATRAAENAATTSELNALFGWTGTKMANQPASCCRTIRAQIFPRRMSLCGKNGEKLNDNKEDFFRWWAVTDSNRRHPACKAGALPAELTALRKPIAPDDAVAQ